jgi:hypothetical protein
MEKLKNIVELLAMLNFSFWQIFILVVILLFRKQFVAVFNRMINFKIPVGESRLVPEKSKVVEEIKKKKKTISSLPEGDEVKTEISERLQSLDKEIMIDALERIRTRTNYLWPELVFAYEKQQTRVRSEIRKSTYDSIKNDLELLKSFDFLSYRYMYIDKLQNDWGLQITIEIHGKLFELIKIIHERS